MSKIEHIGTGNTGGTVQYIPLNKLTPSKDNVRRLHSRESVEQLAASILAHGLLQNLTARPELNRDGEETGRYEVPAGGRRLAALKLLTKRKQIAKNVPIACIVRADGIAAELSLAENIEREALHPADEFEAFHRLNEEGLSADAIAARFGVAPRLVRERLKLASVSPKLLALYRDGAMALEQIMAFTVSADHVRQEEVWESLSHNPTPYLIRRTLLESHVPATDRRARFVGLAAYEEAGGVIVRDLFSEDEGGYLADASLLERLARGKLEEAARGVRGEGWKWVEPVLDFPHAHGMARVYPKDVPLPETLAARLKEIEAELETLEALMETGESDTGETEARRRKRVVLCAPCHVALHAGKLAHRDSKLEIKSWRAG